MMMPTTRRVVLHCLTVLAGALVLGAIMAEVGVLVAVGLVCYACFLNLTFEK